MSVFFAVTPDIWIAVSVDMGFYRNGKPWTGYKANPDQILEE